MKVNFYRQLITEVMNEVSRKSYTGKKLEITYKNQAIDIESTRFDLIDLKGAESIAAITSLDKDYPIITSNAYGKGRAIYIGLPARGGITDQLLHDLIEELGIKKGPKVPVGVMARQIDDSHILYMNVSGGPKEIEIKGKSRSILNEKDYHGNFIIAPYEPEFIEIK